MIFREIYRGGIFPIQVLQGEAFNSAAVKKNLGLLSIDFCPFIYFLKNNSWSNHWNSLGAGQPTVFCDNQKIRTQFGLQTDELCTFRMKVLAFGTLGRAYSHWRSLKPIDHLPTIRLWWHTACFYVLGLVFEHWSICSCGVQRVVCRRRHINAPGVTSCWFLFLHLFFKK